MSLQTEHSLVMGAHTEIDKKLKELEEVCFSLKADERSTRDARIRRLQLIDMRDLLLGKRSSL